jgi:flavin reductase (DIM6/NTAB) family NADH-FMN oxidoreductase RutF
VDRVDLRPEDGDLYGLLTAVVVPRPVAWVASRSAGGVDNLAPHSFFNVACARPPVLQFSSVGRKDTLRNVEATREFVVHPVTEPLLDLANASGTNFPGDVGEFDALGIEREPSAAVAVPRVAAAPVALECRLHSTVGLGDSTVVFGSVVHVAVAPGVMRDGRVDPYALRPAARLAGIAWALLGDEVRIPRRSYEEWRREGPGERIGS